MFRAFFSTADDQPDEKAPALAPLPLPPLVRLGNERLSHKTEEGGWVDLYRIHYASGAPGGFAQSIENVKSGAYVDRDSLVYGSVTLDHRCQVLGGSVVSGSGNYTNAIIEAGSLVRGRVTVFSSRVTASTIIGESRVVRSRLSGSFLVAGALVDGHLESGKLQFSGIRIPEALTDGHWQVESPNAAQTIDLFPKGGEEPLKVPSYLATSGGVMAPCKVCGRPLDLARNKSGVGPTCRGKHAAAQSRPSKRKTAS